MRMMCEVNINFIVNGDYWKVTVRYERLGNVANSYAISCCHVGSHFVKKIVSLK